MASVWQELKRRNVIKVAVAYAIVAWLLIQVVATVLPLFQAPDWIARVFTFFVLLGFPVAVVLAWAYDLTPDGVERTSSVAASEGVTKSTGRKLEIITVVALVLAFAVTVFNYESSQPTAPDTVAPPVQVTAVQQNVLPNSLAVLPFENLSLDPEDAFFAIGIHDAIISQLNKISALPVMARAAVMPYADSDLPLAEIADQLNVESIMVGTVRYADGDVRITTQLVDIQTGALLWEDSITRPFENIFEIETEIATAIASALKAQLLPGELERLTREPTDSPEAYEFYLRARTLLPNIGSGDVPEEFHQYLNQAIELDPEFALAYAAKAGDYAFAMRRPGLSIYGSATLADREAMATGYAQKALSIDPNLGLGHMAVGLIHRFNRRGQEAVDAFERAHQLSPNDSDILDDYSRVLSKSGRHDEAIPIARRAADLRPATWRGLAETLSSAGRYDEAADRFRDVIANGGSGLAVRSGFAVNEFMRGNYDEVRRQIALLEALHSGRRHTRIYLYGRMGDREAAVRMFNSWPEERVRTRTSGAEIALAYLGIGDEAAALDHLQRLAENKTPYNSGDVETNIAMNLYADPRLDQPEFVEVRRRLGFNSE